MPSPFKKRTNTGCSTCRMRRKKCDEEKPRCTGCKRNQLICQWACDGSSGKAVSLSRAPETQSPVVTEVTLKQTSYRRNLPVTDEIQCLNLYTLADPLQPIPGLYRKTDCRLFDHYLRITSAQLSGRVEPRNPFLSHLIPTAYADSAILQCILAVSGAQLHVKSVDTELTARSHYAVSLRSVKHKLLNWRTVDTMTLTTLLASTLLLAFFEIVIGDINGNFHFHLRASRTILLDLLGDRIREADSSVLDLLTEIYSYFAISTYITLNATHLEMPQDPFLSTQSLGLLNEGTDAYGVQFGAAHQLFALIPAIAYSARQLISHRDDEAHTTQLKDYEKQIVSWTYNSTVPLQYTSQQQTTTLDPYNIAGQIYQHALLIYLYTMFNGARPPTPSLIARVEPHVMLVFQFCTTIPRYAVIQTTLLWPVLIASSCLRDADIRANILVMLQQLPYTTGSVRRMFEFLNLLWKEMDRDECTYGPWGIEKTMAKTGFKICCA